MNTASNHLSGCTNVSPTCFLHIPKSGGTSIFTALERVLEPGSLAPQRFDTSTFCDFEDFELLQPTLRAQIAVDREEVKALNRYRVVAGHFSLATLLQIAAPSQICTVLREPRARLLSLYLYWRAPGLSDPWEPYRAVDYAQRPLAEFLSEPRLAAAVDNQVCRALLHGDPRLPRTGFAAPSEIEAIATDAITRLDALGFVGVLELGDSTWRGMARLFEVDLRPVAVNTTGRDLSPAVPRAGERLFSADAVELIEQRSAADAIVYEHALAHARLGERERERLRHSAFARQLVKMGELTGHSAARVAEQARELDNLRADRGRLRAELAEALGRAEAREHEVRDLHEELQRHTQETVRLHTWLDAVHASASWRLTAPLRATKHATSRQPQDVRLRRGSLAPSKWSVDRIWWFAFIFTSLVAVTDALLGNNIILIPLLAAGPCCGPFTGRRKRTAAIGIWAVALAVLLCIPDEIWGTQAQLIYLTIVVIATLASIYAATFIERRRGHRSESARS